MIAVNYHKEKDLAAWYSGTLISKVKAKRTKEEINSNYSEITADLFHRLDHLDEKTISDILVIPLAVLVRKYEWIKEYVLICDFVSEFNNFREEGKGIKKSAERLAYREEYFSKHEGIYLSWLLEHHQLEYSNIIKTWKKMKEVHDYAEQLVEELNSKISLYFSYDKLTSGFRHQFFYKTKVKVCPYCNRQYVHSLAASDKEDAVYLGDLDHLYPKNIYALFSMSLWNLVPCCKVCNQIMKKSNYEKLLFPTEGGFSNNCHFRITYKNTNAMIGNNKDFDTQWDIATDDTEIKEKIANNVRVFKLNEQYKGHKTEIQDVLRKRYLYSGKYFDMIKEKMKALGYTEADCNRLLYGVSLMESKFLQEPLSKMIFDIVNE